MINGEYCIELNNWFQGTIVHETRFKLRIREGLNVQLRIDK